MKEFQDKLPATHELGLRLANFAVAPAFHIRDMSWRNPNVIVFSGMSPDGAAVELIQHISQLNLMLEALPSLDKADEKGFRIGFDTSAQEQENNK